jgi:hypothetical protein
MKPALWGALLLAAGSAGCSDPPPQPEVALVLQSDLSIPIDADGVQVAVIGGPFAPDPTGRDASITAALLSGEFPVSLRVIEDRPESTFSTTVQLLQGLDGGAAQPSIVLSRTVTDIPFSAQKTMLVLPLLRRCACQGTTCPTPGDPDCDNIDQPVLQPFDPMIAPPSSFAILGSTGLPEPPIGNH